jgi:hypothetical protein
MTILHYLVAGAALVAAAGMLAVSYLAILAVQERKQPLLCMDSAPCKYRTDEYCSIKEEDQAEQHEAVHIKCESCGGLIEINNKGDAALSGCDTLSVKDNGSMFKIYCGCKDNPHDHRIRTIKKRKGCW